MLSHAAYFRQAYGFEQEHRTAGSMSLFHAPRRAPGLYHSQPVSGVSLQISRRINTGAAIIDLGHGRIRVDLQRPVYVVGPAGQPCSYDIPREMDLFVLELPGTAFDELEAGPPDLGRLHSAPGHDAAPMLLAEHLWFASAAGMPRLEVDAFQVALSSMLLRLNRHAPQRVPNGGLAAWQLARLCDYLQANLATDVSLAELSALVGLSTFLLCRAFRISTGLPPHRWQLRCRLERAMEILRDTSLPVSEVALIVGYGEPSKFAKAFRSSFGVNPTTFRRQRRN